MEHVGTSHPPGLLSSSKYPFGPFLTRCCIKSPWSAEPLRTGPLVVQLGLPVYGGHRAHSPPQGVCRRPSRRPSPRPQGRGPVDASPSRRGVRSPAQSPHSPRSGAPCPPAVDASLVLLLLARHWQKTKLSTFCWNSGRGAGNTVFITGANSTCGVAAAGNTVCYSMYYGP